MKVKELQEKLNKLDPDLDILCYSESEDILPSKYLVRVLDISNVDSVHATPSRNSNGIVSIAFGTSDLSKEYAGLKITSDL